MPAPLSHNPAMRVRARVARPQRDREGERTRALCRVSGARRRGGKIAMRRPYGRSASGTYYDEWNPPLIRQARLRSARPLQLNSSRASRALGFLFPAAARRLLPIDHRMSRRLISLPALAGVGDGGLITAVEHVEAALVVAHSHRPRPVGDEQEARAIGVLLQMGEPYRLAVGLAGPRRAVPQEGIGVAGPDGRVSRAGA